MKKLHAFCCLVGFLYWFPSDSERTKKKEFELKLSRFFWNFGGKRGVFGFPSIPNPFEAKSMQRKINGRRTVKAEVWGSGKIRNLVLLESRHHQRWFHKCLFLLLKLLKYMCVNINTSPTQVIGWRYHNSVKKREGHYFGVFFFVVGLLYKTCVVFF